VGPLTDEPAREMDEITAFVQWLAGEVGGDPPEFDPAVVLQDGLPDRLVGRLEEPRAPVMDILRRLCTHPEAKALLPTGLS